MWLLVDSTDIAADRADQIAELVEKGHSFKADDIEDLANQIGVPADALAETVEGYNACVKAGVDTQIAPGKELLGTELSDPAYYASKRIPTIHYTMGGLCITTDAQVCTEAGEPIPNLFACGEVTGGVQGATVWAATRSPTSSCSAASPEPRRWRTLKGQRSYRGLRFICGQEGRRPCKGVGLLPFGATFPRRRARASAEPAPIAPQRCEAPRRGCRRNRRR